MRLITSALLTIALTPVVAVLPTVSGAAPSPQPVAPRMASFDLAGVDVAAAGTAAPQVAAGTTATTAVLTAPRTTAPFDLVAVTWQAGTAPQGLAVSARVRSAGAWSSWQSLQVEDAGPDAGSAEAAAARREGTGPLLTQQADGVQVRVDSPGGRTPLGLKAELIDGGTSPADGVSALPAGSASAAVATPTVITRAQWGADESLRSGSTSYNTRVKALVLHHTAGSNSYSSSGAYAELRATYAYHTRSLGWSDIGYNIIIDRYGRVYEGRKGSITAAVVGAHAGGFNTDTFGVSVMGNLDVAQPPAAVVSALERVMAWKAQQYGIDPTGSTQLTSSGGGTAKYAAGTKVTKPTIMGHRDVGYTACPGRYLYPALAGVRSYAKAALTSSPPVVPPVEPPATTSTAGVVQPLVGDWDGDGKDEWATWTDRSVKIRKRDGSVATFSYGLAGDIAVAGDWNRDGKDSIGVFRNGIWYLRNSLSSGDAEVTLALGRAGDRPVVGRWPGMTKGVGLGVVRGNTWYLRRSLTSGPGDLDFSWGRSSDVPRVADTDDDGMGEPVVFRDGRFYLGNAVPVAMVKDPYFGRAGDVPFLGDFDGDGRATPGIYRPSTSTWHWRDDTRGGPATTSLVFGG